MTSGLFHGNFSRGLAVRVLLFLSLALLPIGITGLVQNRQIAEQSRINAELSLLAVTERLSAADTRLFQKAFGAADALGTLVRLRQDDVKECSDFLNEYKSVSGIYHFVGFIEKSGMMVCSSSYGQVDFSGDAGVQEALASGGRRTTTIQGDAEGNGQQTIVLTPVRDGLDMIGLMAVALPTSAFTMGANAEVERKPLVLATFTQSGTLLAANGPLDAAELELPTGLSLRSFAGQDSQVVRTANQAGLQRAYAVLPIEPNAVYAIGVWPHDTPLLHTGWGSRFSALLPFIMWLASLIVAFWALNQLAITHIRKLGRQMRRFALNRTLPQGVLAPSTPTELVEIEEAFIDMAQSLLRDEATLEDSLYQQNILLKEVHHRVKNNLQLISSIMNMQIRQTVSADAKLDLRRLQQRILGLAAVHENLYRSDNLVRVDASVLLKDVVDQLLAVGSMPDSSVVASQNYDQITLDPDQAAPLTLLISEVITNALKYGVANPEGEVTIDVALTYVGPAMAMLSVSNYAQSTQTQNDVGLGTRLIDAFARQLNGKVEVFTSGGKYELHITFPVSDLEKEARDY